VDLGITLRAKEQQHDMEAALQAPSTPTGASAPATGDNQGEYTSPLPIVASPYIGQGSATIESTILPPVEASGSPRTYSLGLPPSVEKQDAHESEEKQENEDLTRVEELVGVSDGQEGLEEGDDADDEIPLGADYVDDGELPVPILRAPD